MIDEDGFKEFCESTILGLNYLDALHQGNEIKSYLKSRIRQ